MVDPDVGALAQPNPPPAIREKRMAEMVTQHLGDIAFPRRRACNRPNFWLIRVEFPFSWLLRSFTLPEP